MKTIQFPSLHRAYDKCGDAALGIVCVCVPYVPMIYPLYNSQCGDRCKTIYAEQQSIGNYDGFFFVQLRIHSLRSLFFHLSSNDASRSLLYYLHIPTPICLLLIFSPIFAHLLSCEGQMQQALSLYCRHCSIVSRWLLLPFILHDHIS